MAAHAYLEDVRLSKGSAHPDVPSGHIAIDELRASVSLLPLLVMILCLSFFFTRAYVHIVVLSLFQGVLGSS